jgi:23S rRNA pseudouridine2605 synthase
MKEHLARERIAKVIARRSIHSRREAEALVRAGRVALAGETVLSPALDVAPDAPLAVDGVALPPRNGRGSSAITSPRDS